MTASGSNHTKSLGNPGRAVRLATARRVNAMRSHAPAEARAEALDSPAALRWLKALMAAPDAPEILVLDGPGEPLATPGETISLLAGIRRSHPALSLRLATNGLGLPGLADELVRLLDSVVLLADCADAAVAASLYRWIRPATRTVPIGEGAAALVADQKAALGLLYKAGIPVFVESRCVEGVNDGHLAEAAKTFRKLGAAAMRVVPASSGACCGETLDRVRLAVAEVLPPPPEEDFLERAEAGPAEDASRPLVAVATTDGISVNAHLGQAGKLMIYGLESGNVVFKEARETPEPGEKGRWLKLAKTLPDCRAVLAAHAGEAPRMVLSEHGISLLRAGGDITASVRAVFAGNANFQSPSCDGGTSC